MSGHNAGGGPPDGLPDAAREHAADRSAVADWVRGRQAPFRVAYKRDGETVEEVFHRINTSRGGEIVELYHQDGRRVTVHATSELDSLVEVQG